MKQSDQLILRELQAIGAAFGLGGGSGGGGSSSSLLVALEEQTDATNWLGLLRKAGSQVDGDPNRIIVQRYPPDRIVTPTALPFGTARLCAFYLPKQKLISGIKFFQTAPASGITPTNSNHCALFSYVPGETGVTQRAISANNGALWTTFAAMNYGFANFTTPYLAPAGIYYGAVLFNATGGTGPSLGSYTILNANAMGGTNTLFTDLNFNLVGTIASQNSLLSSYLLTQITQASGTGYQTWLALY